MPLIANRSVIAALWAALAAALGALGVALAALWRSPGPRAASLVIAVLLLCIAAALGYAIARERTVNMRVRHLQDVEHDLRASEAKFAGILDIAADAIITVDVAQRIAHFNQGAERIFGYAARDVIGRPLEMLIPSRYRVAHGGHMERFAAAAHASRRMGERREIFGLRNGDVEFPAEASISKLPTPAGWLFTVVLRDITDRVRIERQQRFLAAVGEQLAVSLDYEATVRTVANLAVPELADACVLDLLDGDQLTRRVVSTCGPERVREPLAALAEAGPIGPDSPSRVIDVLRTRQADLVPVVTDEWLEAHTDDRPNVSAAWRALGARSLMIVPLLARERAFGAITLVATTRERPYETADLVFAEEIARRFALALENARLYHAARTATRARDEVLGVVSHDLQNPLSAITMGVHVLTEQPPADVDGRRQLLRMISESAAWMQRLIRDLLDMSALEAGRLSVERRPERAHAIVASAVRMLESAVAERGVALEISVPNDLPVIDVDAARIEQVLVNLLGNAIKFTASGGRIVVRASAGPEAVELSIADCGIGIPLEEQAHVFERYYRARHTTRRRGAGLGLAIAKGIIEQHGGRIWLQSTVGEGSVFSFTLPLAHATAASVR
jgi:PAS domain S-box-containing protein